MTTRQYDIKSVRLFLAAMDGACVGEDRSTLALKAQQAMARLAHTARDAARTELSVPVVQVTCFVAGRTAPDVRTVPDVRTSPEVRYLSSPREWPNIGRGVVGDV